jgi:hypothetical protein
MAKKREDTWETDFPSSYDPDRIYSQSVDAKGHSALLHVRVKPWIASKISELIAARKLDYKTPQDFVRDALVHRLHYWLQEKNLEELDSILGHIFTLHDYLEEEQRRAEHEKVINDMTAVVNNHLTSGGREEAIRIVNDMRNNALGIPNKYWRNRYLKAIDERFGHLLK